MPAQRGFNLLVVHGDGRRIARVNLPRRLILAVLGLSLAVPASVAVIYTDYLQLRSQRASLNELTARVAEQQEVIDASRSKMRQIHAEIDGWRDLQAKMWEPFGPENGSAKRVTGIGGGTGPVRAAEIPGRAAIGDELEQLTGIVKEAGDSLRALERFIGRATRALAALPSRWPVRGQVNSGYGSRTSPWLAKSEFHRGLDIGAPVGTPVKSPAPGTVVFAGVNAEYGQTLIIDHGNETKSLYGHLSRLSVAVSEKVQRGEVIALTGNTGRSSGPHLHYEIQVKGQAVNPTSYLWE
ncbi:MAG TPA: M23 family metallopeptidase [Candidatus Dormibacteraeota bacterium]|nr:M23 family metallopeptidase [Candidatus Dormibacteraeota bacterium]